MKIEAIESSSNIAQLSMQLYTGATPGGMMMHNTLMVSPQQSHQANAQKKQPSHTQTAEARLHGEQAQNKPQGGAKPLNTQRLRR